MANVRLTVGGRPYTLGCADGDEPELERLAAILDAEVANARAMIGEAGDARLLMLAGLLLADRASPNASASPSDEAQRVERVAAATRALRSLTARFTALTAS